MQMLVMVKERRVVAALMQRLWVTTVASVVAVLA
jgi:hypothetical protein